MRGETTSFIDGIRGEKKYSVGGGLMNSKSFQLEPRKSKSSFETAKAEFCKEAVQAAAANKRIRIRLKMFNRE